MFDGLKFNFTEVQWAIMTVIALYTWFSNRMSASGKEVSDLRERVGKLEQGMSDMPSSTDIAKLEGDIREVKSQLTALTNSINSLQHGINRLNDYLLNHRQ